jgi:hypothetical protein
MGVIVSIDSIDLEVTCKCGAILDARVSKHNDEIIVDPCEECLKEREDKGYDRGYNAGYDEGKEG